MQYGQPVRSFLPHRPSGVMPAAASSSSALPPSPAGPNGFPSVPSGFPSTPAGATGFPSTPAGQTGFPSVPSHPPAPIAAFSSSPPLAPVALPPSFTASYSPPPTSQAAQPGGGSRGPSDGGGGTPVDLTVLAFAQWLSEVKAQSSSSLHQMLSEMTSIRDGISSNSSDVTEFRRYSTSVQQQMQGSLSELREKLSKAYGEITALVNQNATTHETMGAEIAALRDELDNRNSEFENLKKHYAQTNQLLQNHVVQIQNELSMAMNEITSRKNSSAVVQETVVQKLAAVESGLAELAARADKDRTEGGSSIAALQSDIGTLHDRVAGLSGEFFEHKRTTASNMNKLQGEIWNAEDRNRRSTREPLVGYSPSNSRREIAEPTQLQSGPVSTQQVAAPPPVPLPAPYPIERSQPIFTRPMSGPLAPQQRVIASPRLPGGMQDPRRMAPPQVQTSPDLMAPSGIPQPTIIRQSPMTPMALQSVYRTAGITR